MFKVLKRRKVSNLKENSILDIDIVKTLGDVKISNLKVENDVLNAENETLNLRQQNIILQNENSIFDKLKSSGTVLNILSLLSFGVSTLLSLISGYMVIKNIIKFIGYSLIMLVCQLIIFISSRYSTITRDKFFHKYLGLKFMQVSMMIVSLVMNIMFIHECFGSILMDFIMFPLCFVLDYSTIYFSNLGHDFKTLTFHKSNNNKTIFGMLLDNLTYKVKSKIYDTYYQNHSEKIDPPEEKFSIKIIENIPEIEGKKFDEILEQNNQILEADLEQKEILKSSKKILKINKKFKNKIFRKKTGKSNDLKIINNNFFAKKPVIKNTKNSGMKTDKILNLKFKKVKQFLDQNYNQGDCINSSELQKKFKLKVNEYRNILGQLKNENVVYTSNRKTYMSDKLKVVK